MTKIEDRPPLVSIIIPAHNRAAVLQEALQCVARQTYPSLELIVVDDGSSEDIRSVVEQFGRQVGFPVRFYRQDNAGPGIARRTGLQYAEGQFVQYLDSDDEILPPKIQLQVEQMLAQPDAVMSYTPTFMVAKDGRRNMRKFSTLPTDDMLATALQYRRWHTSSCLWRYPDKDMPLWAPVYRGEDLVHDVSVGVHYRLALLLPEPLTLAKSVEENISSDLSHDRQDLQALILVEQILVEHGLHLRPEYADPLAERFYAAAFHYVRKGLLTEGRFAFEHAVHLSRSLLKKTETTLGLITFHLVKDRWLFPYILLFQLHRRIVPPEVHCYRNFR